MKKPVWPKWAPLEVIEYYDSIFGLWGANELRLLLTDSKAEKIWSKLKNSGIDYSQFCTAVTDAIRPPNSDKSPTEFNTLLTTIENKAYELALLIEQVPELDLTFKNEFDKKWLKANPDEGQIELNSDFFRYRPQAFFDELMHISNISKHHQEPLYERPNVENADALFFIKSMASFFRNVSGKPHTGLILICIELLFPDYPASKKNIEKAILRKSPP